MSRFSTGNGSFHVLPVWCGVALLLCLLPASVRAQTFAQALASGQWPNATNTGVPASVTLTAGVSRTITTDNTVVSGERIPSGGLVIAARNVTVRNCWITSSFGTGTAVNGTGVISVQPGASVTIDHCTLDGSNRTHAGIWYQGASLVASANNIYGVNDGIFAWDADNFTLQDNYLHDFTTASANGHIDGFQTEGASHGVIRHNTFDVSQNQNSCVAVWDSRRNSDDILIDSNLMAGGGFTVYVEDYSPSETTPAGGFSVTNVHVTNNVFSTVHYPFAGYWGIWYPRGAPTDGWNRSGNTILETGQNVDNNQPAGCPEGPSDRTAPTTPGTLRATAASATSVALSWTASSDNVGVTVYRVERNQGGASTTYRTIGIPSGATFTDTGLVTGTAYTYRVMGVDAAGNVSAPATANVTTGGTATAPSITAQPANQSVTVGKSATFSVTAAGTAPLSYQWRKNGTNIAGATAATYTTPVTAAADNGALFSVVVSNSAGSVTSNAATLTVTTSAGAAQYPHLLDGYALRPPFQVPAVDYYVGVPAALTLKDPATLSLTGVSVDATAKIVTVSGANVVLDGYDFTLGGAWSVRISGKGTTVQNCRFGAAGAPIDARGGDLTVRSCTFDGGGDALGAQLWCLYSGSLTVENNLFIRAQGDGIDLVSGTYSASIRYNAFVDLGMQAGSHPDTVQETGVITSSLVEEYNLMYQTAGGPEVNGEEGIQVSGQLGGNITGGSLDHNTIVAKGPPISMSAGIYINSDGGVVHGIQMTNNYFDPTGMYFAFYPGQTNNATFLNNFNMVTGAKYPDSGAAVAPAITTQPANQSVIAGLSASFSIAAGGTAPLSYQWQKNGIAISGATAASYTTPATVLADSGAQFRCIISNSAGSITSNAATLTVVPPANNPPVVTSAASATPSTALVGQTVAFTVAASDPDSDALTYAWDFGDSSSSSSASASHAYAAAGTYTAAVTVSDGKGGSVSSSTAVTVSAAAPGNVTVRAIDQFGTEVAGASVDVLIAGHWQTYPTGSQVQLTVGKSYTYAGDCLNHRGSASSLKITATTTQLVAKFWRVRLQAVDQHNASVPDATLALYNTFGSPFNPGAVLTLPYGAKISYRGQRQNMAAKWTAMIFKTGLNVLTAKFVSATFQAVATDGTTLVPNAQIQIYNSTLGNFANNSVQALPYPATITARALLNSQPISKWFAITTGAGTTAVKISTTYVKP